MNNTSAFNDINAMKTRYRISLDDGSSFFTDGNETLLAAAQRANWLIRYGCRNGNCNACAATLLAGAVIQHNMLHEAPGETGETHEILLCLCHAQSDLRIRLAHNPLPGSFDNAQRIYARVTALEVSVQGFIATLELPAGRKPQVLRGQFAVLEIGDRDVRSDIEIERSQRRELVLHIASDVMLTIGEYVHLRYPLGTPI